MLNANTLFIFFLAACGAAIAQGSGIVSSVPKPGVKEVQVPFTSLKAALYDVGSGSQFGEMDILAMLDVTLSRPDYESNVNMIADYSPDMTFVPKAGISAVFGKPVAQKWEGRSWNTLTPPVESPTLELAEPIDWRNTTFKFETAFPAFSPIIPKKKSEAVLSGRMTISFRVVSGRVTKVEVESLEITDIQNRPTNPSQTGPSSS